jgi:cytochrome c
MADSLEFNKISAAVLLTGIVILGVSFLSEGFVEPIVPAKDSFVVAGAVEEPAKGGGGGDAAPAAIPPVSPLLAKASATEGEGIAKKCATCHTFVKDGPNKVGPNLWGVIGRGRASHPGFDYSDALKKLAGTPWNYEEINKFITNPKAYANGTKMSFAGLAKPEERANVIAYLRTLSDTPQPLPQ